MRVHDAVWNFALKVGNVYAKDYAQRRQGYSEDTRSKKDSKWLRGRGGVRLRKAWNALSESERTRRLQQFPDASFPARTNGILDERCKQTNSVDQSDSESGSAMPYPPSLSTIDAERVETPPSSASQDIELQQCLSRLRKARAMYHKTVTAENLVQVQDAYNNGDMTSLLHAVISAAQHAVLHSRSADCTRSSEEAYAAVGDRLTDVFAGTAGVTNFDPEPQAAEDRPSADFAVARITNVARKYRIAVEDAYQLWATHNHKGDPDAPLLEAHHQYFGKPHGVPSRTDYLDVV